MGKKPRNKKGQFSIIAALLVAIVLVTAVVTTYSIIRNSPLQEPPHVLGAIDEMNLSIKRILGFAVGYYGSILQVTGNTTYAKDLTARYLSSGLRYIADSHPAWNPSFSVNQSLFYTKWYELTSYSSGNISVIYSLSGLGIYGIQYATSSALNVTILETINNQTKLLVTRDGNQSDLTLGLKNFFYYCYSYSDQAWKLVPPGGTPSLINGTYILQIPTGVDQSSYMVQVADLRGIMATAFYSTSGRPQYTYTFNWNATGMESIYSSLTNDTIAIEALQNGTLRLLGQNLQLTTQGKPIPPIPVKAFRVNQTRVNGENVGEVPFQIEDWGSNYRVPISLSSNASIFSGRNMLVFLVNHNVRNVTVWWDGRDMANQTSYAITNRYFNVDTVQRTLTNGIVTLKMDFSADTFKAISTAGASTCTAELMRINNVVASYGSAEPTYAISNGTVRAVVQHEVEWDNGGAPNSPDIYAQIVLTLPANATYYTYALRTIFVNSSSCPVNRILSDLSPIQLYSDWIRGEMRALTENGTSSGFPVIAETFAGANNLFYNFSASVWAHHWSEYVTAGVGAGIMFTDDSNFKLYAFDGIAGDKTGALDVTNAQRTVWATPAAVYDKCGETSPYVATRAIDGDTSTSWRHSSTCNHWIILDMGTSMNISRIRIYQSSDSSYRWGRSSGVEVYVSDNPSSWGSAVWVGTLDASGWQPSGAFTATGRYVRLYSRSNSSSQRLYEVQVETQERQVTIELDPVNRFAASFEYPLDIIWYGAVVTFDATNPIYSSSGGNIGLWVIVEHPPIIVVT